MKQNDLNTITETIREMYTRGKNYIEKSVHDFSRSAPAGIFFAPVLWPSDFYPRQDERTIHIIGGSLLKTRKGAEKRAAKTYADYRRIPGCADHALEIMMPIKIAKIFVGYSWFSGERQQEASLAIDLLKWREATTNNP